MVSRAAHEAASGYSLCPMSTIDPTNATLIERIDIHESLALFRVAPDSGQIPDFEPGQFVNLGLPVPEDRTAAPNPNSPRARRKGAGPRLYRRPYSIASPRQEKRYLEFYLVHIDDGRLTSMLWKLRPGDRLFMDERIQGTFTLEGVAPEKDVIAVATGTGLAPFVSMYLTYRQTGRWRSFVILEGCRHATDLAYHEMLTRAATEDQTLTYLPMVTREPSPEAATGESAGSDRATQVVSPKWTGLRGRVHHALDPIAFADLTGSPLSPETAHVLLCGNPDMIDEAEANLQRMGFIPRDRQHPDGNLHFERYW